MEIGWTDVEEIAKYDVTETAANATAIASDYA